jgi:hypothetical protein
MASLGETFVTKSYMKGKKMPNKKDYDRIWRPTSAASEGPKIKPTSKKTTAKKAVKKDYPNIWRPKSAGSEGPKVKPTSKKTMAKRSMPKRKAM